MRDHNAQSRARGFRAGRTYRYHGRASAKPEEEGFTNNVSGIPQDARVLFPKTAGVPVPWDEALRLLDVKDVLAIVE